MIRAGDLNMRGLLQRRIERNNDSGGQDVTYQAVASIWCGDKSAIGLTGHQLREAQRLNSTLTHAIQVRHRDDITPTMRLVIGALVLTIEVVADPEMRRRELILQCSRVLPNG